MQAFALGFAAPRTLWKILFVKSVLKIAALRQFSVVGLVILAHGDSSFVSVMDIIHKFFLFFIRL